MPMNSIILQDQAAFTASTAFIDASPGRFIDHLNLNWSGESSDNSVPELEAVAALVNPIEVFLKGSPVIQLTGEDLLNLNTLAFGRVPASHEGDAPTDDRTRLATQLQIWQPPRIAGELQYRFTYATQGGIDTAQSGTQAAWTIVSEIPNQAPPYLLGQDRVLSHQEFRGPSVDEIRVLRTITCFSIADNPLVGLDLDDGQVCR